MPKYPRLDACARRLLISLVLLAAIFVSLPASAGEPEAPPPPPPPPESSSSEEEAPNESDQAELNQNESDKAQSDQGVAVEPPQQSEDRLPEPVMAVGRIFTGGLIGMLAAVGGGMVGGIAGGVTTGPQAGPSSAYGILFGASLAVPLGYYAGARLPDGEGSLAGTYLGALGAYTLAATASLADEEAVFIMLPLTFIGSAIGNEVSHAHNNGSSSKNAAGPARDTTGVSTPMIGTGPGDVGLSLSFAF